MSSETIFEYVAFTNSKCYWLRFEVNYQHLPHCINKTSYTFKCFANTELLDEIVETSQENSNRLIQSPINESRCL